ncbi:anti-sigma factor [Devosia rhodophyticola]|uniref:Anti-sigma factor n=1 Tax=Devosia rhodophyticola TaxID=3026423 RepID=A0ABY7YUV4_9HYPH|nr:anti-sigma factor [Devosia rhodophyticola]WDR04825.1 anti-sigma factor [Devosia rhodophyticola]
MSAPMTREMLMAFADGQLSPADSAAVRIYLETHADAAAEVALLQRQRDAIATLYAPAAAEPVPARLRVQRLAAEQSRHHNVRVRWAAAAIILVGLGLGAGWFGRAYLDRSPSANDQLMASAVYAHNIFVAEKRHAVEVVAAEQDHLVSWLSNRLATPIGTPDLTGEGFFLVGGRLLPGDPKTGRAAQIMYENAAAERVTVYITAAVRGQGDVYENARFDQTEALFWTNPFITCTVVGTLPDAQMKTIGRAVYQQLTALEEANKPPERQG